MNSAKLWKSRAGERLKELAKYIRYMFNDHLLFIVIIAIGGGAYYYQGWVNTLTSDFPTSIVMSIIFSFLLASGTIINLLKEPDKVFLLPVETKLKPFIFRSFLLTIGWHLYIQFMVLLVLAPLFIKTVGENYDFLVFCTLVGLLKVINLYHRWNVDFDREAYTVTADFVIRILLNGFTLYFFFENIVLFIACLIIICLYILYFAIKVKGKVLPWERLIENEEKRMMRFYQFANLFTDVPKLKNEVKRRKWLDLFLRNIPFQNDSSYMYLISRTFFRSGDYFGLFLRLTIIGGFLVFGFSGTYIAFVLAILFIYLTGFQLFSLWKHHDALIWLDIYPINEVIKTKAFLKLMLNVLWTQNIIFTLIFLTSKDWINGLYLFLLLSVFIYGFIYIYGKKRISKMK